MFWISLNNDFVKVHSDVTFQLTAQRAEAKLLVSQ